jgi:hypothetical protein
MRQGYISIETAEVLMALVATVGFVVVILSKVPEWTHPEWGAGSLQVGRSTKLIK